MESQPRIRSGETGEPEMRCCRDLDRRKAGQSWQSDPSQNQSLLGDPLCGLQKSQPKQPEKGLKRCVKTGSAACSFRNQRHSHRPLPDIAPFKYRGCPFDLGPLIRGISISFFQGTPKKCSTNKKNDSTCRKTRLRRETWRRAHGFLAPPAAEPMRSRRSEPKRGRGCTGGLHKLKRPTRVRQEGTLKCLKDLATVQRFMLHRSHRFEKLRAHCLHGKSILAGVVAHTAELALSIVSWKRKYEAQLSKLD